MSPWLYVDAYNILDLSYVVYAFPLNPCEADPDTPEEWLIAVLLHVGKKGHQGTMSYPTRQVRDEAFETLCQHLRRAAAGPAWPPRDDDDEAL